MIRTALARLARACGVVLLYALLVLVATVAYVVLSDPPAEAFPPMFWATPGVPTPVPPPLYVQYGRAGQTTGLYCAQVMNPSGTTTQRGRMCCTGHRGGISP